MNGGFALKASIIITFRKIIRVAENNDRDTKSIHWETEVEMRPASWNSVDLNLCWERSIKIESA